MVDRSSHNAKRRLWSGGVMRGVTAIVSKWLAEPEEMFVRAPTIIK
jgi:hypothetical protein